jgi:hypothetical protein
VERVALDSDYNQFAIVFSNKERPKEEPKQIVKTEEPLLIKSEQKRVTHEWSKEEKEIIASSKTPNEAVSLYHSNFPESKRSKSSIVSYYYFSIPKSKRDKIKSPLSQKDEVTSTHLKIGDKVVYAGESKVLHPIGEVIELSSNKSGTKKVLIQFGINDKIWAEESKYRLTEAKKC